MGKKSVLCREVVPFLEGPLIEVPLYTRINGDSTYSFTMIMCTLYSAIASFLKTTDQIILCTQMFLPRCYHHPYVCTFVL